MIKLRFDTLPHHDMFIFTFVGAFASDTLRRIHMTDGNFDEMVRIHRELRAIVKHTTNAYSFWFLFHWLIFGVTAILGFVVVALYKLGEDDILQKIYFGIFFGLHIFHFIFPCVCAAYITTVCACKFIHFQITSPLKVYFAN